MSDQRIEKMFIQYLNTYHKWLKSILDILINEYLIGRTAESREKKYVNGLSSKINLDAEYVSFLKGKNGGNREKSIRNLLNSWYSECALRYPFNNSDERMKFASWKIIQFYYTIFTGLSSLNRDIYDKGWIDHNTAIDIFVDKFLYNEKLGQTFFIPPYCFILKEDAIEPSFEKAISWQYGLSYHCPNIEECLIETKKKRRKGKNKITSIFHFFKDFRQWATYESAYMFINLYGQSPKAELDMCLNDISFCFNYLIEKFQIEFYGYDEIKKLYQNFINRMHKYLNIYPQHLETRFSKHDLLS